MQIDLRKNENGLTVNFSDEDLLILQDIMKKGITRYLNQLSEQIEKNKAMEKMSDADSLAYFQMIHHRLRKKVTTATSIYVNLKPQLK